MSTVTTYMYMVMSVKVVGEKKPANTLQYYFHEKCQCCVR